MRIGLDASSLMRLPRCGMHHHTYEILKQLSDQNPADQYVLFFDQSLLNDPLLDRRFIEGFGANYEAVPLRTVGPTPTTARLAWLRWYLPQAAARHRIDLFHGFSHSLAHLNRTPTVVTVHDLMPEHLLSWTPNDPQARRARRHLESAIRRAHAVCAVSAGTRRDVLDVDVSKATRIAVVPNAVRKSLVRITERRSVHDVLERYRLAAGFILTVGADTPRRNYSRLIDAVAAARRTVGLSTRIVIVGASRWPDSGAYRHATDLGIRDQITFLSDLSDDDLAVLYSTARAYVCPTLHEGFCMPVLEALACGTRVICSDLPVLREVAGDVAHYFCATDIASIARSLIWVSQVPELNDSQRGRSAAWARRFSWAASAQTVRELYDRVYASVSPPSTVSTLSRPNVASRGRSR